MHQIERLVDISERHHVGDHRVDLDLSFHVPVDDPWHVGASARAAEGGAFPDPAGDELERPRARLLLAFGISAFCILIVKSVGHEETWIVAGGTLLTLFACFSWPSTITIDAGGITSNVWWKPKVIIPWNAVADLEKGAGGDWTIYASGGKTLSFSRYHVDPQRFEAEVLKRANIGRPREKSEPTTLRL